MNERPAPRFAEVSATCRESEEYNYRVVYGNVKGREIAEWLFLRMRGMAFPACSIIASRVCFVVEIYTSNCIPQKGTDSLSLFFCRS